jgi:hypothetical protein
MYRDFRLLVKNLIEEAEKAKITPTPQLVGSRSVAATNV